MRYGFKFASVNNISTVCHDSLCDFTLNVFTQLNKAIKTGTVYAVPVGVCGGFSADFSVILRESDSEIPLVSDP